MSDRDDHWALPGDRLHGSDTTQTERGAEPSSPTHDHLPTPPPPPGRLGSQLSTPSFHNTSLRRDTGLSDRSVPNGDFTLFGTPYQSPRRPDSMGSGMSGLSSSHDQLSVPLYASPTPEDIPSPPRSVHMTVESVPPPDQEWNQRSGLSKRARSTSRSSEPTTRPPKRSSQRRCGRWGGTMVTQSPTSPSARPRTASSSGASQQHRESSSSAVQSSRGGRLTDTGKG